jgi:tetratricopeptide (TPR) repeat protein
VSGDPISVAAEMMPYVSAAVSADGGAVLAQVRDDAADATVRLGGRLLRRVFGARSPEEPLPEPLAALVAAPDDPDALATLRRALGEELSASPVLAGDVSQRIQRQQIQAARDAYVAGRDMTINNYGVPAAPRPDWPIWAGERMEPADHFQDRPERQELARAFGEGDDDVVIQSADMVTQVPGVVTQALIGTGGVGKTQLAVDFARKLYADNKVDLVVWVNASERPTIISTYAEAAKKVGASAAEQDEQAARDFVSWLAEKSDRRWLVVLDNVADEDAPDKLWPPRNDWGRTIVTTRQYASRYLSSRGKVLKVRMFTPEDAVQYLQNILSNHPGALQGDKELASVLGYHPLAIAAAAAYIREVVETGGEHFGPGTCTEYIRRFDKQRAKLTDLMKTKHLDGYEHSMAAVWSISIDQVDKEHPSGIGRRLMLLLSLLDPNGIPFEILDTPEVHEYLQAQSTDEIELVLQTLRSFSLISFGGADNELVNIHVLVQRAVRETTHETLEANHANLEPNHESLKRATRVLAGSMSAHWPKNQHNTVPAGLLRANAAALSGTNAGPLQTPGLHELLFQLGDGYGKAGLVEQAHQYFTDLGEQVTPLLGADSPDMLRVRERNAYWLGFSGKAAEALAEFEAIAASLERTLGPEHVRTFAARHDAARFRGRSGDAQGAVDRLRVLVADETSALGDEHKQTLQSRNILGYWLNKAGHRQESLAHLKELLAFRSALHGCAGLSECADDGVLTTRIDLSITKADLEDYDGAVVLAETAVRDRLALDGLKDAATMSAVAYLACWRALRRDENGVAELETSVAHHLDVRGERHNNTLRAQAFLIVGLYAGRRITKAEAIAAMTSHLAVIHELFGLTHVTAQYCQEKLDEWQREEAADPSEEGS